MSWHRFYKSCLNEGFGIDVVENNVRSDVIEKIHKYSKENGAKFEDAILAFEGGSWRKKIYPYYKANRKVKKEENHDLIEFSNKFVKELKEVFPFMFLQQRWCEGDDIISIVARYKHVDDTLVIISRDHDFLQLIGNRVYLYNPFKKEYVTKERVYEHSSKKDIFVEWNLRTPEDAAMMRRFHVLRGDAGDGIPNIISDDDVFVNPTKKQRPFGPKRILDKFFTNDEEKNKLEMKKIFQEHDKNCKRNQKLIDLRSTPKQLVELVLNQIRNHKSKELNVELFETWCNDHELYMLKDKILSIF